MGFGLFGCVVGFFLACVVHFGISSSRSYDVGTPWDWFVLHDKSSSPDEDHKKSPVTSTSM